MIPSISIKINTSFPSAPPPRPEYDERAQILEKIDTYIDDLVTNPAENSYQWDYIKHFYCRLQEKKHLSPLEHMILEQIEPTVLRNADGDAYLAKKLEGYNINRHDKNADPAESDDNNGSY